MLSAALAGAKSIVAKPTAAQPIAAYTTKGAWSFVSAPKLHPPKLSTGAKTQFKQLAPGYFMVANFKNQGLQ